MQDYNDDEGGSQFIKSLSFRQRLSVGYMQGVEGLVVHISNPNSWLNYAFSGHSCPGIWKYPLKCPKEFNLNTNKTEACCYDNGPNCCKPGGRRCTDEGASKRDYCPRPNDDEKLKRCCVKNGKPSCCASSGVYHNFR